MGSKKKNRTLDVDKVKDANRIKMTLLEYDRENKIILAEIEEPFRNHYKAEKKGMDVTEFKTFVRKKYGDRIDIINNIKKQREKIAVGENDWDKDDKDDKYNLRDIKEIMRNDDMKLGR